MISQEIFVRTGRAQYPSNRFSGSPEREQSRMSRRERQEAFPKKCQKWEDERKRVNAAKHKKNAEVHETFSPKITKMAQKLQRTGELGALPVVRRQAALLTAAGWLAGTIADRDAAFIEKKELKVDQAARMKAATELRSLTNSPKAAKLAQSLEQQAEQRGAEVEAVAEEQLLAAADALAEEAAHAEEAGAPLSPGLPRSAAAALGVGGDEEAAEEGEAMPTAAGMVRVRQ